MRNVTRFCYAVRSIAASVATCALLALLAALSPIAAGAQEPVRLTLEDAQARAARHNPGYQRTTNSLETSSLDVRAAWRALIPSPSVSLLSTGVSWNLQRVANDIFGNPVENPDSRLVQSAQTSQSASLSMNLDFRNYLTLRQEKADLEMAEEVAAVGLDVLHGSVALEFLTVQELQLSLVLNEALLEEAIQNREAAEQLYSLGRSDRLALVSAELAISDRESQVEESRASLENATLSLRNLIGDASLSSFEIVPAPLRAVDLSTLNEERLVAIAQNSNPEIRQQESSLANAGAGVTRAWMQWLPSVDLSVSTSRTEASREGAGAFFALSPDGGWGRQISLRVQLPNVGTFFSFQENKRRQEIGELNQAETLREVRMRVDQEIQSQIVGLRLAVRSMQIQEERVTLADEAFELSLESYRLGNGTFEALQAASNSVAQARRQVLQARHDVERELIALERTLGVSLQEAGVAVGIGG